MAPCDESYSYSCNNCSRVFNDQIKLNSHQKTHQEEEKLIRFVNRWIPLIILNDVSTQIHAARTTYDEDIGETECTSAQIEELTDSDSEPRVKRTTDRKCSAVERKVPNGRDRVAKHRTPNHWGMHKCLQCGIIFNKEVNLRIHKLKRHNNKSPFSCRVCGKKFLSKVRLESHQASHSSISSPIMPELEFNNGCDVTNSSSSTSQPPELNAEGESSQTSSDTGDIEGDAYETCLTCGDAIAGPDILIHISTHIQGQTDCLHCDFEASHPKDLLDHMTVHYGLKTYICSFEGCGKAYHWKHSLARHMANSHSNPFQCSSCDASFSTLREEKRHALTHIADGDRMNTEAAASLSEDSEQDHKKNRPRPYKCQHCHKMFMKKKQLKSHEAIHLRSVENIRKPNMGTPIRKFNQPILTKPRRKKNNESSNADLDSDKRSCQTCGEEMVLSDLLVHIRGHVTKDQRQCELCQHVYANVESLREHMHTHYGLEPHKCTICHKTYSLKQSVLNHIIRNHKAAKPLEYYLCMIPAAPKVIKEAVPLTPKKHKNIKPLNFPSNQPTSAPVTTYNNTSTPTTIFGSHLNIVQTQLQVHSSNSQTYISNRVIPSTSSSTPSESNGFSKKTPKPINFQCNFCTRVFTTKFSVQRHEAKLHGYVETDHKRMYKTTYATAEDSSDAYAMDSQSSEADHWEIAKWEGSNGNSDKEMKYESLRSEIRSLLFLQDHSNQEFMFKEIPANLY